MNLDNSAVKRKDLDFDGNEPLALKPLKNFGEGTIFTPPIHSGVNGMPVTEFFWETSPLATIFRDIEDSVENLEIIQGNISPLSGEAIGNAFILFFGYVHGASIPHEHNPSNSMNSPYAQDSLIEIKND